MPIFSAFAASSLWMLALVCGLANTAAAQFDDTYLLDPGGVRSTLEDHGVEFESILTGDLVSNLSGGIERDTVFLMNLDFTMTLDTERAFGLDGGQLFLYALGNTGEAPSAAVGELQTADNIEARENFLLYEAWYQQVFARGTLSVLIGLYDYNSEFNVLEYATVLINSSFAIDPSIAQSGPSIFPETSLSLRLRYQPGPHTYFQVVTADGVPGDPNHQHGTRIHLSGDDGVFYGLEIGEAATPDESKTAYHKMAIGAWLQTTEYEDFSGETRSSNHGIYFLSETSILREDDDNQGLGMFFQFGYARPSRNPLGVYLGTGLQYVGAFPGRDLDVLAFGLGRAKKTDAYKNSFGTEVDDSETVWELSYVAQVFPNLSVQPDLQWIENPGTGIDIPDSLVGILRFQVAF